MLSCACMMLQQVLTDQISALQLLCVHAEQDKRLRKSSKIYLLICCTEAAIRNQPLPFVNCLLMCFFLLIGALSATALTYLRYAAKHVALHHSDGTITLSKSKVHQLSSPLSCSVCKQVLMGQRH